MRDCSEKGAGKRESGIRTTPSVPDPISCVCAGSSYLRACLHGGGGPQVGDVTCLGGVTCLSIESLILIWSRLHNRWGDPPHVTSPIWGPPLPCKQALSLVVKSCTTLARIVEYCDNRKALTGRENDFQVRDLRLRTTTPGVRVEFGETPPTSTRWSLTTWAVWEYLKKKYNGKRCIIMGAKKSDNTERRKCSKHPRIRTYFF